MISLKIEKIIIGFDAEKLKAVKFFMPKDRPSLEEQLTEQIEKIYQKVVPQPARLYIEEVMKDKTETGQKGIKQSLNIFKQEKAWCALSRTKPQTPTGSAVREGAV